MHNFFFAIPLLYYATIHRSKLHCILLHWIEHKFTKLLCTALSNTLLQCSAQQFVIYLPSDHYLLQCCLGLSSLPCNPRNKAQSTVHSPTIPAQSTASRQVSQCTMEIWLGQGLNLALRARMSEVFRGMLTDFRVW